jgi:hypothetical protein
MYFIRRSALRGDAIDDPLASRLTEIGRACDGHGDRDVPRFLALDTMFPTDLRSDPRFTQTLVRSYDQYFLRSHLQDTPT